MALQKSDLHTLRHRCAEIEVIDPTGKAYLSIVVLMMMADDMAVRQLHEAKIAWISGAAHAEMKRRRLD